MAVIKANGYGHGMLEMAEASIAAGATWLGVATLDEALTVRSKFSINVPILVLGYIAP
jgi:alanine racemase